MVMNFHFDLMSRGICPACTGSGRVIRFVPVEDYYPCGLCEGSGRWMHGNPYENLCYRPLTTPRRVPFMTWLMTGLAGDVWLCAFNRATWANMLASAGMFAVMFSASWLLVRKVRRRRDSRNALR